MDLVDPIIIDNCQKSEVARCIHICLLCVQDDPEERPILSTIYMMLTNDTVTLSVPQQPGFFVQSWAEKDPLDSNQPMTTTKSVPRFIDGASIPPIYIPVEYGVNLQVNNFFSVLN